MANLTFVYILSSESHLVKLNGWWVMEMNTKQIWQLYFKQNIKLIIITSNSRFSLTVTGKETKKQKERKKSNVVQFVYIRRRQPVSSIGNRSPPLLLCIFHLTYAALKHFIYQKWRFLSEVKNKQILWIVSVSGINRIDENAYVTYKHLHLWWTTSGMKESENYLTFVYGAHFFKWCNFNVRSLHMYVFIFI